jgi:hypothetical protein
MALSPNLRRMVEESAAMYRPGYPSPGLPSLRAHFATLGFENATKRDLQRIVLAALAADAEAIGELQALATKQITKLCFDKVTKRDLRKVVKGMMENDI